MKKIFTLLLMAMFASQISGKPPEMLGEKMRLPESMARLIEHENNQFHPVPNGTIGAIFNTRYFLNLTADKSQKNFLDSIIYINTNEPDEKLAFVYDNEGRVISFIFFDRDNGAWTENSIMLYTYHTNNLVESMEMRDLNVETGSIEPVVKYVYTYDSKGNVSQTDYYFFEEGEWALLFKDEFTYNSNNNLTTEISYIDMGGSFMAWTKTEYTWENGNNTLVMHYNTDYIGGWNNSRKEEYTYNNADQVTLQVFSKWEDEKWNFESREQYTYQNSKVTERITQEWNTEENKWMNLHRYLSQYHNNQLTLFTAMKGEGDDWVNDYKEEMTYDNHDNMTVLVYSNWVDGAWVPFSKEEFSFDHSVHSDDLVYPYIWFGGMDEDAGEALYLSMIKGTKYYEWIDGNWVLESESTYYWSRSSVTGTDEIPFSTNNGIFPNPANDRITVSVAGDIQNLHVSIYDLRGRMLLDQSVSNDGNLYVGHLNKGIYMVILRDDAKLLMAPQKLIVR